MPLEQYANLAQSTAASSYLSTDTSIGIVSATGWPSVGQFRVLNSSTSELMLATAISGTTLTVQRGVEGTTAAAITSGDPLLVVLTKASLGQMTQALHGHTDASATTTGPYTILPTDELVTWDSSLGGGYFYLPSSPTDDEVHSIADVGNLAATYPATVNGNGNLCIGGVSTFAIGDNGAQVTFRWKASKTVWLVDYTLPASSVASLYTPYTSRPTAGVKGRRFMPTDGPAEYLDTGSLWLPIIPGSGTPANGSEVAPANVSPFSSYTGSSSLGTPVVQGGTVTLQCASAGSAINLQGLEVARSSNQGPQAWLQINVSLQGTVGVYVRDSSGGKLLVFALDIPSAGTASWIVSQYTNGTTLSSSPFSDLVMTVKQPIGMRLRNDGVNYYAEFCVDGTTWVQLYSQAVAAWVPSAGDKCGVVVSPFSAKAGVSVLAFAKPDFTAPPGVAAPLGPLAVPNVLGPPTRWQDMRPVGVRCSGNAQLWSAKSNNVNFGPVHGTGTT